MIRIIGKIPKKVTIACSGGIDSMVVAHFLQEGRRKIQLAYFNHDTQHSFQAQKYVEDYAIQNKFNLIIGGVIGNKASRQSLEEFWRIERYKFLDSIKADFIITCHHLDDCVETWLMSSCHGQGKLIPYRRNNIHRPFLITSKSSIKDYAAKKEVEWIEDPSNSQTNFMRNHIRHNVIPQILKVNPGIRTTIRKKLVETYRDI